jgi:hypothetical protein
MSKQEVAAMTKVINGMINNGLIDELVVACLTNSIDSCFRHIKSLTEVPGGMQPFHKEDFQDAVDFIRAAVVVLRHYSLDSYQEELKKVNTLALILEDPF